MARSNKIGIEYFSHDVDMMNDKKIKLIKAKHGLIGYAVFLRLLEEIYREEGYYLKADEDFNILFCDENNIQLDAYESIINDCLEKGLFDKGIFEKYSVLTSKRIQLNYCAATERRKEIEFIKEFLLINPLEKYNIDKINVYINSINANINNENVDINTAQEDKMQTFTSNEGGLCSHDVDINRQSKVKESKVKEIKEYNMSNTECSTDENSSNNLPDNQNASSSPVNYQKIQEDYNAICIAMPKCRSMTDKRKKKVRVLFKNLGEDIEAVRVIFEKAQASDFLSGRNGDWSCNFDWLINYNNAIKVLEGNYDNKATGANESKLNDPRYKAISDWYKEASTT